MTAEERITKIYNYLNQKGYDTNDFDSRLTLKGNQITYSDQSGKIIIICTSNSIFYEEGSFDPYRAEDIYRNCFITFEDFKSEFEDLHCLED